MNNYPETIPAKEYLRQKGILFREAGEELIMPCQFSDCDKDSRENEAHLYMSKETGQYHCKKCNAQGNLLSFAIQIDGNTNEVVLHTTGIQPVQQTPPQAKIDPVLVEEYHQALPPHIRKWLNDVRGIDDDAISQYKLGWHRFYDRNWITVPIQDKTGKYIFLKLRRDPNDKFNPDKYKVFPVGSQATIYGWDSLKGNKSEVVICEGEFDRLVLASNLIPAITSTAGAGTFKKEWFGHLKDLKQIHIAFDTDETGKREAAKLAAELGRSVPNTAIHIANLPSRMTEGKDITDFFVRYNGSSDELLYGLSKHAAGKKLFKPIPFSGLSKMNLPPLEWLIEKLITEESISILSGQPASFKTWIILHLAIQMAKGEPLFGKFATKKSNVLIIDEESGLRRLKTRLAFLTRDEYLPIYFVSSEDFKLTKKSVYEIISFCEENDIKVVMFDSLVRMHTANENEAAAMAGVGELLKQIKNKGISILLTHHHRKQISGNPAQDMRGSSDIFALLDCHLAVSEKERVLTIMQTKLRDEDEAKPFEIAVKREDGSTRFEYIGETEPEKIKRNAVNDLVIAILDDSEAPLSTKEILEKIQETMSCGKSTLKTVLEQLVENEEIIKGKGEKNANFYSLEPFEDKQVKISLS